MRCALIACLLALAAPAHAQISTDGSVGEMVDLLPDASGRLEIPEVLGQRAEGNLLHSFERFGVPAGVTADFTSAAPGIARVLARVTGAESSRIDGLLRSSIPGADLFLINPAGIVFGNGGAIDVPGSFHASTATALHLADGTLVGTDPTAPVVLTWALPAAWGFEGTPAPIGLEGSRLEVGAGQLLALTGGELSIRGRPGGAFGEGVLVAPAGRVELTSVASEGRVTLTPQGVDVSAVEDLGAIDISQNAQISTAGASSGAFRVRARSLLLDRAFVFSDSVGPGAPAPLAIDIDVRDSLTLRGPAELTAELLGSGDVGDIRIRAGVLDMSGTGALVNSWVSSGSGSGGDVRIDVGTLELRDGAQIRAQTNAAGAGGHLQVRADVLRMDGRGTQLATETVGRGGGGPFGAAGDLDVDAGQLEITDLAQLFSRTRTEGAGGDVRVVAGDIYIEGIELSADQENSIPSGILGIEDPDGGAVGARGAVHVLAGQIELRDGGQILSRSFASSDDGDPGSAAASLVVEADRVTLIGGPAPAGIRSRTLDRDGGLLELRAGALELRDGGVISASTSGRGRGGDVAIHAETIRADGKAGDAERAESGIFSQSLETAAGDGGNVAIATGQLTLSGGARISVATRGPGDGGNLGINVPGADPRTDIWATQASIDVTAAEIRSSALSGAGAVAARSGGDIEIHAGRVRLGPGGRVSALNEVRGDAGDVSLRVRDALELDGGAVTTEAADGLGGSVVIRAGRLVHLRRAAITTSVSSGVGDGGNIDIDPDLVVVDRSRIEATADAGNGGAIRIVAGQILLSGDCAGASCIDASSERGIDGEITLSSPVEDVLESTRPADPRFSDASDRLDRGCAARRTRSGSLTLGARVIRVGPQGAIPPSAGGACRAP